MKYTLTIEGDNIEEMLRGLVHMWSSQTSLTPLVPERPLSDSPYAARNQRAQAPKPPAEPEPAEPAPEPAPEPEEPPPAAAKSNGAAPKKRRGRPVGSYVGEDGKLVVPEREIRGVAAPAWEPPTPSPEPVVPDTPPPAVPAHTDAEMLDQVRAFTVAHKHLNPQIDALLKTYGADRVSKLPQDIRGTFLVQMNALLAQPEQPPVERRDWA